MKSIKFKQVDSAKRKVLLSVYFVFALSFIAYAFASDSIIFFINSFQRGIVPGILATVIFIVPLVLIMKYSSHQEVITFEEKTFEIRNRNRSINIRYAEIETMYLNKKDFGVLELLDAQQNLLFAFVQDNNDTQVKKIAAKITAKNQFEKTIEKAKKRKLNYTLNYDIITYIKTA